LALARQVPEAVAATHQGRWPRLTGISLQGKVVGVLGLGAIGKELVRRLSGFDCHILAYDPFADPTFADQYSVQLLGRETVVEQADFLSLHLPLLPETRKMVDGPFLASMKPGAFLINTSRGEVVDEDALYKALHSGHLRGAALDAFTEEPPDANHPLLDLPQVIATPHLGAQTDGATNTMGWMAFNDCLAVLRGDEPAHAVRG
ncbi:MAG TPA: NAD(P)-dependent oxidoreductase, partial [Anaerolineaceae bacterium]